MPLRGLARKTGGSAAVLVAASNSSGDVKARADYLCDGTADEVQINAAIAEGRLVQLSAGTFTVSSPITGNMTGGGIIGSGQDDTIIRPSDNSVTVISIIAADDFYRLQDFNISGISGGTGDGIVAQGETHNFSVKNVRVSLCNVGFSYSTNTFLGTFENCRADTCDYGWIVTAGTTLTWINCYANQCVIGYQLGLIAEATLIGCAADGSDTWAVSGDQAASAGPSQLNIIGFHAEGQKLNSGNGGIIRITGEGTTHIQGLQVEQCGAAEAAAAWHTIQMQCFWEQRVSIINSTIDVDTSTGTNQGLVVGSSGQEATSFLYRHNWKSDVADGTIPTNLPRFDLSASATTIVGGPISINQGASDGNILRFISEDVAHGMTDFAESSVYGRFIKQSGPSGGLIIEGLAEHNVGIQPIASVTTESSATDSSGFGAFRLFARKKSGTGSIALSSAATIFSIENDGEAEFLVKGNGNLWSKGTLQPTLPVADPGVPGQLWVDTADAFTVKMSS